jgi:hypothetical protein
MIASTVGRVPAHTAREINENIRKATENHIVCAAVGGAEAIERRLSELDREWDVERALEANAAVATLTSVVLGVTFSRKWLLFPAVIGGFLLQHALSGWCPPVPILRRLGFRTQNEIGRERYALKALRGDLRNVAQGESLSAVAELIKAVSR